MAATVTWEDLRALAGFRAVRGCVVSFYLNLDPHLVPTAGAVDTRINSLLDEAGKYVEAHRSELTHAQRVGVRDDLERIRRYTEFEFDRDGTQGLAVFSASLDGVWRPVPLAAPVPNRVKIDQELYLAPLVPLVGRGEGALVAVVGRERGDLYRLTRGRLEEVGSWFDDQPRRHDQGGWSQARRQRHVDELAHAHLRHVAEELDRRLRRDTSAKVVIVAAEESRAELAELLSNQAKAAVVGWTHAEAHAAGPELLALAIPVLERWHAEHEARLVERWRDEAGRNGRAAAGWAETLEAASDGRVELLLCRQDADRPAWRCPGCGRLAAAAGKCPLDGTELERHDEGLDLAVHQTLAHGGTIWSVERPELEAAEGIGALLRY
jgi:peptide chain release factor subunit 1